MNHATDTALDKLECFLTKVREFPALKEKKRGIFYYKSQAFLHFHEDPTGLFADVRITADWQRLPVNKATEQKKLLEIIGKFLAKC